MKFARLIAAFLILVMASSQSLAASCATSCSASEMLSKAHVVAQDMKSMSVEDCHSMVTKNGHKSTRDQCNMAGCHLAQAAPFAQSLKNETLDLTEIEPTHFIPIVISADLVPPIKPPA